MLRNKAHVCVYEKNTNNKTTHLLYMQKRVSIKRQTIMRSSTLYSPALVHRLQTYISEVPLQCVMIIVVQCVMIIVVQCVCNNNCGPTQ